MEPRINTARRVRAEIDNGTMSDQAAEQAESEEDWIRRAVHVVRTATGDEEYEPLWPLLKEVVTAGEPAALARAVRMLARPDSDERRIGSDLLGVIAESASGEVKTAAVDALLAAGEAALAFEAAHGVQDGDELWSIAHALNRAWERRTLPVLLRLADHPDSDIRLQAALGLFGAVGAEGTDPGPDPAGVAALVALTRDADPDVRNWATFGLGNTVEADSPEIRAALWERVGDEHAETREEGICGLALRREPQAVGLVAELLADREGARLCVFAAAQALAAPELVPYLEEYDLDDSGVADALAACRTDVSVDRLT